MKKKSIVMLATGVILAASLVIGGTLAYFSDTKAQTNTFTVGSVTIELDEGKVTKNPDNTWDFTDKDNDRTDGVDGVTYENVYPGAELPKDPTITNTGSSAAYIRAKVTLSNYEVFANQMTDVKDLFQDVGAGWTITEDAQNVGTFIFTHATPVDGGKAAPALFQGVKIPGVGFDLSGITGQFTLAVKAEAIQADGFVDAADAFKNLDAELANANP